MTEKELRELFPDYEMLEPMTKEQLMNLKKKINELSEEDKKQRDLYLSLSIFTLHFCAK